MTDIGEPLLLNSALLETKKLVFQKDVESAMHENHEFLKQRVQKETIYGVNTGFGPLVDREISNEQAIDLQYNLTQQLSGNMGPVLPYSISRLIFKLRIRALSQAKSGVSFELFNHLVDVYNLGYSPKFREWGSVGASGDLVPLTSLPRFIAGKDEGFSPDQLQFEKIRDTYTFKAKEGLALVNGTSFSTAINAQVYLKFEQLLHDFILPTSILNQFILDDSFQHLSEHIYSVKAHATAKKLAKELRDWVEPHPINHSHGTPQAPYTSRSIVLWLGSVLQRLEDAKHVIEPELNAVDDNPLFFHQDDLILHAANFQGTYAAYAADNLATALTMTALIIERSINRITHDKLNGNLPAFLADEPIGVNNGLQGLQLLATSLLADIKSKNQVHSTSSIPTNADNQDIVSMSANAALNAYHLLDKVELLVKIYILIVGRAYQLSDPEIKNDKLKSWIQKHIQRFISKTNFSDSDLDFKELLNSVNFD